jgi:hypothetical protein
MCPTHYKSFSNLPASLEISLMLVKPLELSVTQNPSINAFNYDHSHPSLRV